MTSEELVQEYQNGDAQALDSIVKINLGLVKFLCNKRYQFALKGSLTFDDLVQEASIALMKAAKEYRPGESPFSTYASSLIKFRIYRVVHSNIPRVWKSDYESESIRFKVLDEPVGEKYETLLKDTIEDEEASTAFHDMEDKLDRDILKRDLTQLIESVLITDKRAIKIIFLRYPLDGTDPKILKDVGEELGLTAARIGQLEHKALNEIRESEPGKAFKETYRMDFLDYLKSRIKTHLPEPALIQKEKIREFENE